MESLSMRVLILNAPIGGGHTAIARALAEMLRDGGAEAEVRAPVLDTELAGLAGLYRRLTTGRVPLLWSAYYCARRLGPVRRLNGWFIRRRLAPALQDIEGFDVVVLTHHMYAHCLPQLANTKVPVVVLVTDLFGGPLEWFASGARRYVVPSRHMWHEARRRIGDGARTSRPGRALPAGAWHSGCGARQRAPHRPPARNPVAAQCPGRQADRRPGDAARAGRSGSPGRGGTARGSPHARWPARATPSTRDCPM